MHKTNNMNTTNLCNMKQTIEIEKGRTVKNIEVSDGMVVINYEEEFCPKDGDFWYTRSNGESAIFILKGDYDSECKMSHALLITYYRSYPMLHTQNGGFRIGYSATQRLATESEKQQLLDALAKEGFTWNAEKKVVEKKRWKAKEGDAYWYCEFSYKSAELEPQRQLCGLEKDFDDANFRMGDFFRTKEDCQKLCDILNKTIADFMNK
jgi:hypothetical protein